MPERIKVEIVNHDRKAFMLRTFKKNEKFGVFCAEIKYGKGWDIVLRQDGMLMAIANKDLISYSQLIQIYGSGCHLMAVSQGVVFTNY